MRISAMANGVAGLQAAEARFERAAARIAAPVDRVTLSGGADDLGAHLERITASHAFRANLKTIQTADQMSNDLLELLTRR